MSRRQILRISRSQLRSMIESVTVSFSRNIQLSNGKESRFIVLPSTGKIAENYEDKGL